MGAEYFEGFIREKLAIQTAKNRAARLDEQSVPAGCLEGTTFAWHVTIPQIESQSRYNHSRSMFLSRIILYRVYIYFRKRKRQFNIPLTLFFYIIILTPII